VLTVISIVICCGLALSFSRKRILLLCFFYFALGFLTIVNEDTVPLLGGLRLYRVAYPFLLLSVFLRFIQDPTLYDRIRHWPNLSYAVLIFTLVLSSLYTPYIGVLRLGDPFGLSGTLVVVSLFLIGASHMQQQEDFVRFALITASLSFSVSVWVIWTAAQGDFTAFRGGTNINENYESLYVLAGAIPLVEFILTSKQVLTRVVSTVGLLATLFASAILASRGPLIAAALGVSVTAIGLLRRLPRRKLVAISVAAVVLIGGIVLLPGASNVVNAFQDADVTTLDNRTVLWRYAWTHFCSLGAFRTLFGEGLSSGLPVLSSAFPDMPNYHNAYLMWLMERGITGLVVFLVFLFRVGYSIGKTSHPHRDLMRGWYVYVVVAGLTATVSNEHLFWLLLGVIIGAASQNETVFRARTRELAAHHQTSGSVIGLA
jgi:O-antigen ligase